MKQTYFIYFTFRGQDRKLYVQDFGNGELVVNMTDSDLLRDFTGKLSFTNGRYIPGYIRNPEAAKDLPTLISAIQKQLR